MAEDFEINRDALNLPWPDIFPSFDELSIQEAGCGDPRAHGRLLYGCLNTILFHD